MSNDPISLFVNLADHRAEAVPHRVAGQDVLGRLGNGPAVAVAVGDYVEQGGATEGVLPDDGEAAREPVVEQQ